MILIIIALGILGLGIFLYKILKEETNNIIEDKKQEEELRQKNRKVTYIEKISKNGLESVLNSIKDKPEEVDNLKNEIQSALRNATKASNTEQIREYNEILKKIDKML